VCDSHSQCHLMNDGESVSSLCDGEFLCHLVSDGESPYRHCDGEPATVCVPLWL
jgi:hypothetical protein